MIDRDKDDKFHHSVECHRLYPADMNMSSIDSCMYHNGQLKNAIDDRNEVNSETFGIMSPTTLEIPKSETNPIRGVNIVTVYPINT